MRRANLHQRRNRRADGAYAPATPQRPPPRSGGRADGCLYFYSHRGRGGWFSQFYASPFVSDGEMFETAEKFMMASKARLMGDEAAVGRIMTTTKPEDAKELGRRIVPWDEALWQANRFDIVSRGTELKFSQNPQLREWLLQTDDTTLVEASPHDTVWGIGLSIADAEAGAQWRGKNLLGEALGLVREKFRAADAAADAEGLRAGPSESRASDEATTPAPAPAPTPSPTPTPTPSQPRYAPTPSPTPTPTPFQQGDVAPAGSPAPSGLAFRVGKHGTTISTSDPHLELVFRLPDSTRAALIGKNPVGADGTPYCRICQTHGSVHGKVGSHKCPKTNRQLQDGTVRPNLHDPIPVGTVVSREFLAMMAAQYGGIHSGPYYATAEERLAAHNSFMKGPATVKCGGGALGPPCVRYEHPILPLECTADSGPGRMVSANYMQPGDEYQSDGRGLEGRGELTGAFTRTCLTDRRSSFTYSLDTGSSSVWSGAGADLGDTVHWAAPAQSAGEPAVGSLAVSNACVYNVLAKLVRTQGERAVAATAAGAQPPPWAVRAAGASAGDLITEFHASASAMFASLGPAPVQMTRTEQWVRELLHDAMRPGHSTSVCLVQAVPIPLLEHVVVRAIEVRHGRVEAVRTVHGARHDGRGAPGFLLLEVGSVAERTANHAMYCECTDELSSDAGWATWARRMELGAGATVAEHSADGGPAMIRRAATVEVADVPSASLPPCAECDGGLVRASGAASTWRSGEPTGIEVAGGCARGAKLAAHVTFVGAVGPKAGRAALDERVRRDETMVSGESPNAHQTPTGPSIRVGSGPGTNFPAPAPAPAPDEDNEPVVSRPATSRGEAQRNMLLLRRLRPPIPHDGMLRGRHCGAGLLRVVRGRERSHR